MRAVRTSFDFSKELSFYVLIELLRHHTRSGGYLRVVGIVSVYNRTGGGDRPNNKRPDGNCEYRGATSAGEPHRTRSSAEEGYVSNASDPFKWETRDRSRGCRAMLSAGPRGPAISTWCDKERARGSS